MITIKTKEEIEILREGGKRHAEILNKLVDMVKPGISAKELNDEAYRLILEGGDTPAFLNYSSRDSKTPFPASLCISINDEVVHGIPGDKVLQEGDVVTLDLGLTHGGLITDAAVTVAVGSISPELTNLLDVCKKALAAGIKAAKGGKKTGDIGMAIERVALAGKVSVVEELAGHGVGYSVHEDPFIPNYGKAGEGEVLKPGMVIAIEPIFNLGSRHIYLDKDGWTYKTKDGKQSAHFEHTVLITKSGAEILTQ